MFNTILQLENAIKKDKEITDFKLNFTVLVKFSEAHHIIETYKLILKKEIGIKPSEAMFNNPSVGDIYSIGLMTNMFMQKIGTKVLGSLEGGIYGILRGLDADDACAAECIEKLKDGKYLLIARGDPEDIIKLKNRFGTNCQD